MRYVLMVALAGVIGTAAVPSGAKEWRGIDFPDKIQVGSAALVMNGLLGIAAA